MPQGADGKLYYSGAPFANSKPRFFVILAKVAFLHVCYTQVILSMCIVFFITSNVSSSTGNLLNGPALCFNQMKTKKTTGRYMHNFYPFSTFRKLMPENWPHLSPFPEFAPPIETIHLSPTVVRAWMCRGRECGTGPMEETSNCIPHILIPAVGTCSCHNTPEMTWIVDVPLSYLISVLLYFV